MSNPMNNDLREWIDTNVPAAHRVRLYNLMRRNGVTHPDQLDGTTSEDRLRDWWGWGVKSEQVLLEAMGQWQPNAHCPECGQPITRTLTAIYQQAMTDRTLEEYRDYAAERRTKVAPPRTVPDVGPARYLRPKAKAQRWHPA